MSRLVFVNLPVKDLERSKAFFGELGFAFDPRFTDEQAACMVVNDQAFVMLLTEPRFSDFLVKPLADTGAATGAIMAVSAADRDEVDAFARRALAAGASPARDADDYGFMYSRSFHDPDGHLWEVVWMSPEAVEQGPADLAGAA